LQVQWLKRVSGDDLNYSRRRARRGLVRKRGDLGAVVVRATAFLVLVAFCVAGLRWISTRSQTSYQLRKSPSFTGSVASYVLESPRAPKIQSRNRRLVYPYSVVPGGVGSAEELRAAATHDSVVAKHYSGFNYRRARLVEVKEPRKVYLSYRLHNKIYWTVQQASLHPGEKLLTDGTVTARARCGNQVSVLPQTSTSPEEPTMAELDRPDAVASGIEGFPGTLDSNLLHIDPAMPLGPSASGGNAVGPGGPPGVFVPPPLGGGGGGSSGGTGGGGGNPPPATPEPGTIVLVISGAGIIFARYRRR
jgi:hypothetical protein